MGWKEQYERRKAALLVDAAICAANREVFREFFEFEEYKLKRTNGLPRLDDGCYRTLYGYVGYFRNVNKWFRNKPWKDLTRDDIKRVFDDLEDGVFKNHRGQPFQDRRSYYNKVFKSKPFRLVQKSELARDVIETYTGRGDTEVRFLVEETFRKMTSVLSNPTHLLLFWLAWDLGENIATLLQLQRKDFVRQRHRDTKEAEYLVNLSKLKLKRSRRARSEPTLYPETVRFADMVLEPLAPEDPIFRFGYRQALKIMHAVVRKTQATCLPNNDPVRWKDLRSGMACHLLKVGWSREEVDARLGHTPNSSALNAYVNYLAIDREKPKKRLFDSSLEQIQGELEETKRREKLLADRVERQREENETMKQALDEMRSSVRKITRTIEARRPRR